MTNPAPTPDDEFAAAFSELSTPSAAKPANEATSTAAAAPAATSGTPVESSTPAPAEANAQAPTAAAAPADGASAAVPGESTPSSDGAAPATPADTAAASSATADPPAATPSEPAARAPEGYVSQDQFAALQAELAALKKQTPAEAPRTETPRAEPPPLYTADEQAVIDSYVKEWPDVAKGEALMRRAEYSQLIKYVFDQFAPRLDALESSQTTVSTRTQYQDIVSLVPDYDAVRDPTLAWIETQPGYLKAAYQKVAEEGSPQDVADLIARFKKETGYVASTPRTAAPAAAPGAGAASAQAGGAQTAGASAGAVPASLPAAAQAAAAALKPVKTTRSEPVSAPDPNDFDAAFKEFASAS